MKSFLKGFVLSVIGVIGLLLIVITIGASNRQISTPTSDSAPLGWRIAGGFSDSELFFFVTIAPEFQNRRTVYNDAVVKICEQPSSPRICIIHFFAQSDRIPSRQPRQKFFEAGGFKDYRQLAVYWRNQNSGVANWTVWDCERAGIKDSPPESLCDPTVSAVHEAAMRLGSRTGQIKGCGWPPTDDAAHFSAYLLTVKDPALHRMYREAFDKMNSGKGPDDPVDCVRLRARSEDRAAEARRILGFPRPSQ